LAVSYAFVREEGYVYPTPHPGTVPLKLFWHPDRGDNKTTTTPLPWSEISYDALGRIIETRAPDGSEVCRYY
jgi:hypothetical protein